jgi:hypothetical protein
MAGGGGVGCAGEFGGYLEDGSSSSGMPTAREEDDAERDIRINIPQQNMNEPPNESSNIISTGIRWLFGA